MGECICLEYLRAPNTHFAQLYFKGPTEHCSEILEAELEMGENLLSGSHTQKRTLVGVEVSSQDLQLIRSKSLLGKK